MLRAAKSVPLFTKLFSLRGIPLQGGQYADSIATANFQPHIQKAIQEGATKILIFDSWHDEDHQSNFVFTKMLSRIRNNAYRKNQLAYIKQLEKFTLPSLPDMFILKPKERLNMSPWEIDNENANTVFMRGFNETMQNEELKKKHFI